MTIEAERPPDRLADIAERAEVVLVDFDGPICRLFGSKAAPRVAADLRQLILSRASSCPMSCATESTRWSCSARQLCSHPSW